MNRLGATDRLCETLVSWRLLVGGRLPGASHHSFITSSEEPPLSNFNSYRDIPPCNMKDRQGPERLRLVFSRCLRLRLRGSVREPRRLSDRQAWQEPERDCSSAHRW